MLLCNWESLRGGRCFVYEVSRAGTPEAACGRLRSQGSSPQTLLVVDTGAVLQSPRKIPAPGKEMVF